MYSSHLKYKADDFQKENCNMSQQEINNLIVGLNDSEFIDMEDRIKIFEEVLINRVKKLQKYMLKMNKTEKSNKNEYEFKL